MDMGPVAGSARSERAPAEPTDVEHGAKELGRRAESLGDSLRSFDKDVEGAEAMLGKVSDQRKREEFRTALDILRGRAGGVGNALRGAVAGLALFAGGVGVGKGMDDDRRESAIVEMAKQSGAAEAENRMLKEQLAKRDEGAEARAESGEKRVDKAMDSLSGQNVELRKQLGQMAKELEQLRKERDDANARVLAEKEKGIVAQDTLQKQQTVSNNLQTVYTKMKDLIDASGDQKLKDDADRFLSAYE